MGSIIRIDTSVASRRAMDDREATAEPLAVLTSAHAGVIEGLRDLDDGLAVLSMADVPVPIQLLVAQSQLAGVRRALAGLLSRDYEDNSSTRELIEALLGRLPDGPGTAS